MFNTITDSLKSAVNKIRFVDEAGALKKALQDLKKSLLKADVHHKVVKELIANIEIETTNAGVGRDQFLRAIRSNLTKTLSVAGNQGFVFSHKPPTVILMSGLQGSGKTTTTGKLAHYLKLKNKKVLVCAADLQRLAAIEQLKQIAKQIEVDIYFDESEKNPIKIAQSALKKAQSGMYDVLLVDTAGRLAIDDELMSELESVKKAINPSEIFYVADALTGQDAVRTATTFKERIGIDGVILSKFDGDTKGGVAISLSNQVGVPLRFVGIGEKMPDLEVFIPERIVGRIMGEGDIATLAEKTSSIMDEKSAKALTRKIKKGEFNFNDFMQQMEQMKKLGSMKSLIGMIPGLSGMIPKDADLENSKEMKRIKSLVSSMTPKERQRPSLLNNSRKKRLAIGAGLSQMDVNRALKQFGNAAKMAKKMSGKNGMADLQNMLAQAKSSGIPR